MSRVLAPTRSACAQLECRLTEVKRTQNASTAEASFDPVAIFGLSLLASLLAGQPSAALPNTSVIAYHESVEEGRKLRIGIERQDVGNILVRSHDDHAALVSSDTAQIEMSLPLFRSGQNIFS